MLQRGILAGWLFTLALLVASPCGALAQGYSPGGLGGTGGNSGTGGFGGTSGARRAPSYGPDRLSGPTVGPTMPNQYARPGQPVVPRPGSDFGTAGYGGANPYGGGGGYGGTGGYGTGGYGATGGYGGSSAYRNSPPLRFGSQSHYGPVYAPPAGVPHSQAWQQTQQALRSDPLAGRRMLDQQLGADPDLNGLMSAVWSMEQAGMSGSQVSPYRQRAWNLARQQSRNNPASAMPWVARAKFSLEGGNYDEFHQATSTLVDQFPDNEYGHYFNGIRALQNEDWQTAEAELRTAEQLGMPKESIAQLLRMAIDRQRWIWQFAQITGIVFAAWAAGLLLLYVVGKVLSRQTLRSVRYAGPEATTGGQRLLRRVYRWVVAAAAVYYYISLPIVVLLALAVPASLGYAILLLPDPALWLLIVVFIVGAGGVITALCGLRAALVRVPDVDPPGRELKEEDAPRLWRLARDLASELGTRPVERIWLSPTPDLSVRERGGYWRRLTGRGRRELVIGAAVLDGLRLNAFRAMLAHEYGHFLHRDTAGGRMAMQAHNAMSNFALGIYARGRFSRWDLALWFLRLFYGLFARLTFGASRLQELLADRVAATKYGPSALKEGLLHVVRQSVHFQWRLSDTLEQSVRGATVASFYHPAERPDLRDVEQMEKLVDELITAPSDEGDTHPSPRERFAMVERLQVADAPAVEGRVWELFADGKRLQEEMEQLVQADLANETEHVRSANEAMLEFFDHAIRHQRDPRLLEQRAALRLDQGDEQGALADLAEAEKIQPHSVNVLMGRAVIYHKQQRYAEAAQALQKLRDAGPLDYSGECMLADCYLASGQLALADEIYTSAMAGRPGSLAALLGRGRARGMRMRYAEALADLDAAAEHFPACPEVYHLRGMVYEAAGHRGRAAADFERAVELDAQFDAAREQFDRLNAAPPAGLSEALV